MPASTSTGRWPRCAPTPRRSSALSPKAAVIFDASFSPRLEYYTGVVFEMTGENGDVLASGGEYDRLLERLGATEHVTASGCALWTNRLEQEALLHDG